MTKALQPAAPARVVAGAAAILALAAALLLGAMPTSDAKAAVGEVKTYIVVFKATQSQEGQFQLGGDFAANHAAALALLQQAGGTVAADLTKEIGVAIVKSPSATFAETVSASGLVEVVGEDFAWKGLPSRQEMLDRGTVLSAPTSAPGSGPEPSADPLESLQWDMQMMKTEEAHAKEAGSHEVDVAVIDSGIDATHVDFLDPLDVNPLNVDCLRSKDFVVLVGPGVGSPVPCQDNLFHGTHVAGTIAARANGVGIVGVAPNVTLISIKVCDSAEGYCYAAPSVAGIAYAGAIKAEVMNMSFFTDDDTFRASTELKCNSDPKQFAFRTAVDRAIAYARGEGALPIAAAGNSETDLGKSHTCSVVPTESPGTISVVALGPDSVTSSYSSYGKGYDMIAAPGGDWVDDIFDPCGQQVLSTIPGEAYGCFEGTSMASPHVAGLAALIASQFGSMGADGDLVTDPTAIAKRMRATANDIGKLGYDRCYGWGRANAWRAVFNKQGADKRDASVPDCGR